ncbi:cinnamoyl ester hydrolase [Enterococcus silesiacus]|uniref:Cinnamoyl ester hydrolase n=2 Tax=Enterococcus silesiacus TaxID=332949 RepID=A0A0S3K7E3_9ENTE|nr:cinnamoyl ester hydrolase [Enterococcus silesiacus]OJG93201.1 transcriptional regulator [Enterococcus silesiacus]
MISMRKTYEQMTKCNCATANTLAIIGGKWKILILYYLLESNRRFNELQRLLDSITPHTLSKELKELQEDGLVNKQVLQAIPPKTDYSLTKKGQELETVLLEIRKFGQKYPLTK